MRLAKSLHNIHGILLDCFFPISFSEILNCRLIVCDKDYMPYLNLDIKLFCNSVWPSFD